MNEPINTRPSPKHSIFAGPDGLRAGWSLLLYLIVLAAPLFVLREIHQLHPKPKPAIATQHDITPREAYFSEAATFTWIFFATWIMSRIERRPSSVYGLGLRHRLPQFLSGLFWGACFLSLLVATLWKQHLLVFETRQLFGQAVLRYATLWLFGFLLVALAEEYLLRGYLQFTLARGLTGLTSLFAPRHSKAIGFWTAALFLSYLFAGGHIGNSGESPLGLLAAGIAGLVFCLSLWRTGSLWWAIGFHCAWDWAQSFLYGVPDSGTIIAGRLFTTHTTGNPFLSGAATGPEGSIFVIPILALAAIVIFLTLPSHADAGPPAP